MRYFYVKKFYFNYPFMFWGRSEQENGKNHAVGVRREKANKKTHLESLLRSPRAETGRGSREVSWKTRGVGVGEQKQARKPKKKTSRNSPRKFMKSFRGESIYKEKSSQTLHEIPHHQLLHPTGIERVLLCLVS